jgi:drug/metabolite transporter (DMT)-like permease
MTRVKDSAGRLRVKTTVSILLMAVFGPMGNILLSAGMKRIGGTPPLSAPASVMPAGLVSLQMFVGAFTSAVIWLGIASLLTFFVAQLLVLSWADYSYVQPASAISYAVVALAGSLFLGEAVSPTRWLGIAIICAGVLIVGRTAPRTTAEATGNCGMAPRGEPESVGINRAV